MARGEHGDSFKTLMDGGVGWKRTKSRLRRKKTTAMACRIVSCVSWVVCHYLWAGICVWVCYLNERVVCEALFFLGGKFGGIGELL